MRETRANFVCTRVYGHGGTNSRTRCALVNLIIIKNDEIVFCCWHWILRITWYALTQSMMWLAMCAVNPKKSEEKNIINCCRVVMQDTHSRNTHYYPSFCCHTKSQSVYIFRSIRCCVVIATLPNFFWFASFSVRAAVRFSFVCTCLKIRITCKRLDGARARLEPTLSHTHIYATHITSAWRS